jgi:hypothetical protein
MIRLINVLPDNLIGLRCFFHEYFDGFVGDEFITKLVYVKEVLAEVFALLECLLEGVEERGLVAFAFHNNDHLVALDCIIVDLLASSSDLLLHLLLNLNQHSPINSLIMLILLRLRFKHPLLKHFLLLTQLKQPLIPKDIRHLNNLSITTSVIHSKLMLEKVLNLAFES